MLLIFTVAKNMTEDKKFLRMAVRQAEKSLRLGGFPAGAILVKDSQVIARGVSLGGGLNDPTGHAETSCIRKACKKLKTTDLSGATLYASLQPCLMCFSAANWAGVSRIVFGCRKTQQLVDDGCYEGTNELDDINSRNTKKIELEYLPDFATKNLEMIGEWKKNITE